MRCYYDRAAETKDVIPLKQLLSLCTLLHGEPGIGKTMMAKSLIEESGRKAFIIRKDKPDGEFVNYIRVTFEQAKKEAPSIVF